MNTSHPRFAARLQNAGMLLLVLGVTVHLVEHRITAIAGVFVTLALLARLWIELGIRGDETDEKLEQQLNWMGLLTGISMAAAGFGLLGLMNEQC
jgi:predicted histidine transporter YuiF (NhaC family)